MPRNFARIRVHPHRQKWVCFSDATDAVVLAHHQHLTVQAQFWACSAWQLGQQYHCCCSRNCQGKCDSTLKGKKVVRLVIVTMDSKHHINQTTFFWWIFIMHCINAVFGRQTWKSKVLCTAFLDARVNTHVMLHHWSDYYHYSIYYYY